MRQRTYEAIASERTLKEEARIFLDRFRRALSFHGYSTTDADIKRVLTEAALAKGREMKINLRKPDGARIKFIFKAEVVAIFSAMGLGGIEVIRLLQSTPDSLSGLLTRLGIGVLVGGGTLVTTIAFSKLRKERKEAEASIREAIREASTRIPGTAEELEQSLIRAEHEAYKKMANAQIRQALKVAAYRFSNDHLALINEVIAELTKVLATPNHAININIERELKEHELLSGSIFSNSLKITGPNSNQGVTQEDQLRKILEVIQHGRNSGDE